MNSASVFQYPARVRRIVNTIWGVALLFNVTEYMLAWLGVMYGWLLPVADFLPSNSPLPFLQPLRLALVLPTLITAHLGLLAALVVTPAIAFLTPRVVPGAKGFSMQTPLGTRFVPYSALRGLRSVALPNERFVVWVDSTKGLPLQGLLCVLLFGRRSWRGFMLTSDLSGFDDVVARIVGHLKEKYGEEKFAEHFSEDKPTALLEMLTQPAKVIKAIAKAETNPLTRREAGLQMASVSLSLAVPALVAAFIHLEFPWGAILLPLIAMLEWPLASLFLVAISEGYPRNLSINEALRLYPLTQLPRWIVALGLTVLVVMGLPFLLYVPAFIPAVGLGAWLSMQLTEDLFDLHFPAGLLGAIVTIIYQIVVYGLFLVLLPR